MTVISTERTIGQRMADGLRALAAIVETNPVIAEEMTYTLGSMNVPVNTADNPFAIMREFVQAGLAVGADIRKDYDETWGCVHVRLGNGTVNLQVYAEREKVCTRRVLGVREVTEEVPDPEVLKAVPTVTVTRTVEDVEWDCHPILLADAPAVTA